MELLDEQISQLLDKFVVSDFAQTWRERRHDDQKKWSKWINEQSIKELSDDVLKNCFLEYFNRGAGRHPFNAIYRDRIVRDMGKFRITIKHLLDESIDIEKRFNDVLQGEYHIEGIGKGLASSMLMDLEPNRYITWNNKTEMGLTALGLSPKREWGETPGITYKKIIKIAKNIKNLRPKLSFIDVDSFLHWVSAEEEGVGSVREVCEGEIVPPEPITGLKDETRLTKGFPMESHLEEFIEKKFDDIDFGMRLELYQDEENTGRQYQTSIGRMDLLAKDQDTGDFVVLELKKGQSSDYAVGQMLRYMGWVKDNLAKDSENVKGIIISKDEDEKIKYALRMLSNVTLYLYEVSFKLTKTE